MNKFELDKTMQCFGLKKAEHYKINGCTYYHSESYYTIVKGKTPYELALLLKEKYDNDIYKIRVNGWQESEVPHTDIYTYHIDTIEGLAAFLLENQDYYSKTKKYSENLDQFLKLVYSKILQGVNPNMSIYEWMLDRENRKDYFKPLLAINSPLDFKIRKRIENFDNIVNPFSNNDLDLNNLGFAVRGYKLQNNNSGFSLTDKHSGATMTTLRETDGFVVRLYIPIDLPYEINILHYFHENGEEIAFEKYDESGLSRIEYNFADNSFGEHYGVKHQATIEDKKFIIQTLDQYIALANNVLEKNLNTKSTEKKLSKKKCD